MNARVSVATTTHTHHTTTQEEYQALSVGMETAAKVVTDTMQCTVDATLDFVCFVCGEGAHLSFCASGSGTDDDHLSFVPYVKCSHCGNVVRAYDDPTVSLI